MGQMFGVNGPDYLSIKVPAADGRLRFWRNTSVAGLPPNGTAVLAPGTLGYEWDTVQDNGLTPPGLMTLSKSTVTRRNLAGMTSVDGPATHRLTLYRAVSGALVFASGTVQWSWGLDTVHTGPKVVGAFADVRMQQATVNLLADMGAQPATLQFQLRRASPSTDVLAPSATIAAPGMLTAGTTATVSGRASDLGGVVAAVEVSVDGGGRWFRATGRAQWRFAWKPAAPGQVTVLARAVDDSGNLQPVATKRTVSVVAPA